MTNVDVNPNQLAKPRSGDTEFDRASPSAGPLIDPFGRAITYLRVSVTDRCDFRCVYCMSEDMAFLPKRDLLTLEELDRLCSAFISRGVRKLRLTGGEPLVRRGIMGLFRSLARHRTSGALDELTQRLNGPEQDAFISRIRSAYEMLRNPNTVAGGSDGGAHVGMIGDAGMPTFLLTHWQRDRKRGPTLPLEHLIKKQTADTAGLYGLRDRGRLQPGLRADVNLIDLDNLRIHEPQLLHDLPAGAARIMQGADGYRATLVAGEVTRENGRDTGARPGRLLRSRAQ